MMGGGAAREGEGEKWRAGEGKRGSEGGRENERKK